jgi:outer membrane protein assembly factor BamB
VIVLLYWVALKGPRWITPGSTLEETLASWFDPIITRLTGQAMPPTLVLFMASFFVAMALVAMFVLWWLLFSRIRWTDRFLGLLAFAAVGGVAAFLFHPSVRGNKPDDAMFTLLTQILPVVLTGWIVWLVISRSAGRALRLAGLVVVFGLTWGFFATLRFEGTDGSFSPEFSFRWRPTAEDSFAAERAAAKSAPSSVADAATATPLVLGPGDWPGFRGPDRDGRRAGVRIATDWKANPPKELWRHRVGPGWSSFAVVGSRLFTQEQFKDRERVVCYDANTGKELWAHADTTRFEEAVGGPGPRATPTFHEGRLYTLGANGQLNCLDAATGKKVWSRDIVVDSGRDAAPTDTDPKVPTWGFAASPLVMKGIVTVFAGGPNGKAVLGYRADSGELAWAAGNGTDSYCSLHPARIGEVDQVIISTGSGLSAFDPTDGKVLWEFEWRMEKGFARVTQPMLVGDADVLLGTGFGFGTRRAHIGRNDSGWKTEQVWETRAIAPYFNDLVIHKDHIYGFHNNFFVCVKLADGKATWKERGYDNGQVLLLPDQDLLLIQAEKGDVALVEAKPDARKELSRLPALKSKTWNHPVVAHGKLYVRNGEEMVCYQLAEAGGAGATGQ